MSINQRVKQVRQALKLSQAKFADPLSVSDGYIGCMECGSRTVNDRMIKLICFTYDVNEHWLRTGEGDDIFNEPNDALNKSILDSFQQLKPEFQDYVCKEIKLLLEIQNKKKDE